MSEPVWRVPLSDLLVDDELIEAARTTVASGWWSMGPRVEELETRFAERLGAGHAFAVANGTAALHLALLAVGLEPGDEVIVPSLNFVAAANTIVHAGGTPVFCDIVGAGDLNLDPADVAAAVTDRTRAIVALHYGGVACDLEPILELCSDRGLHLVEDAAHAPGATTRNGRACGTVGEVGCFSFFSNKNLAVGEGGMIVTGDDAIAGRIRLLRSHGMTTLTWDRHRGHAYSYDVALPGLNVRMDEIHAAIALVQLDRLDGGNAARRRIAGRYRELLAGIDGLVVPFAGREAESSHHLFVVVLPEGVERRPVQEAMRADGVQTSVHYPPIHRFMAYADGAGARRALPRTDSIGPRVLTLPLYPHLTDDQVETVVSALARALAAAR